MKQKGKEMGRKRNGVDGKRNEIANEEKGRQDKVGEVITFNLPHYYFNQFHTCTP